MIDTLDFEKIFMDQHSQEILTKISSGAVIHLYEWESCFLLSLGFISEYALSESGSEYVVTAEGMRYEEFMKNRRIQQQKETELQQEKEQQERFRSWLAIILSNSISFAALITSIIALLK